MTPMDERGTLPDMSGSMREFLDGARAALTERTELGCQATVVRAVLAEGTTVDVTAGQHRLRADEPELAGGQDTGPNPDQLALASLAPCTAIIFRYWSELLEIPIDDVRVEVQGEGEAQRILGLVADGESAPDVEMTVTVRGPASDADYALLHVEVEEHCPVLSLFPTAKPVVAQLAVAESGGA